VHDLRTATGVTTRVRVAAALTAVLVLAGCARTPVAMTNDWTQHLPEANVPSTMPTDVGLPTVTPSTVASPTPTATTTPTPKPKPVDPFTLLSAKTQKQFRPCLKKVVGPGSSGACTTLLLKKLKAAGYYRWGVNGALNTAGANALLNYQRSRGLEATARTGKATWLALAQKSKAVPTVLPKKCKTTKGVILCVDQAHRKLFWIKNHKVVKTFQVRVGGWTYHPKTKKWRIFPTANGTWKVFDKQVNPESDNYGSGAMPYSTMFHPDMYVHYSPVFNRVGYATSSHGCVNIRTLSEAIWIFQHTPIGATVYVYSPKAASN